MRKYLLSVIIILLIGISSCKKDSATEPVEQAQQGMVPLKTGYQWTYTATGLDSLGKPKYTSSGTTKVIGDTLIAGEKWYSVKNEYSSGHYYYRNRDGQYYIYNYNAAQGYYLLYGTTLDDTTKTTSSHPDGRYLIAKNVKVKGPLGEFSCYLYRKYSARSETALTYTNMYVDPKVGLVRWEDYVDIKGRRYMGSVTELTATNVF